MRASLVLTAVLLMTAAPARAQSVDAAPSLDERKVTLSLKDAPLRSAIEMVFKGSGLQYAIEPNVPNVPITLNVREVTVRQALRLMLRQAQTRMAPGWTLTVSRE